MCFQFQVTAPESTSSLLGADSSEALNQRADDDSLSAESPDSVSHGKHFKILLWLLRMFLLPLKLYDQDLSRCLSCQTWCAHNATSRHRRATPPTAPTRPPGVAISCNKHSWTKGCDWLAWCHTIEPPRSNYSQTQLTPQVTLQILIYHYVLDFANRINDYFTTIAHLFASEKK